MPPFVTPAALDSSPTAVPPRRRAARIGALIGVVALAGGLSVVSIPAAQSATVVVAPGQAKSVLVTKAPAESGARVEFVVPKVSKGAVIVAGELRRSASLSYRTRVMIFASGRMRVGVVRVAQGSETTLASRDLVARAHQGQTVVVDGRVSGSRQVVVAVRSWVQGSPRPDWQRVVTDASPQRISKAGSTAMWTYLSRSNPGRTSVAVRRFAAFRRPVTPATTVSALSTAGLPRGSAVVSFRSDVRDASFACSLNGVPVQSCVSPLRLTGLKAGAYAFRVRAVTAFGTVDPTAATASFRVGKAPATAGPETTPTKPSAATTGVPAGTKLKVHQGDIVVTRAGTVLDRLDVRGFVVVKAPNVTISNSLIRGGPATGNQGLVTNYGYPNLLVTDTTLQASKQSVWVDGLKGWDFTARRVHVVGNVDSIKIHGDNVTVVDSLLENTTYFSNDPNQHGGPTHNDNIQILNGRHLRITGNTIRGATNFAVLAAANKGDVSDLTVDDNWVDGGWCTMKLQIIGSHSLTATVRDNKFGPHRHVSYCPMQVEPKVQLTAAGNVLESTGEPIAIYRGR